MDSIEKRQMSESVLVGSLLVLTGGFLDAYSYLCRGEVFANAQTGNIVLLGIQIAEGDWSMALQYLLPVVIFAVGIYMAEQLRWLLKQKDGFHWRQIVLAIEMLVVFCTAFLGPAFNWLANSMISFVCALQVESFRKIRGNACATTMCTGNLRSAAELMYRYHQTGDGVLLKKSGIYYLLILLFIVGAFFGGLVTNQLQYKASLLALVPLFLCFLIMFREEEQAGR
ncbi:MAG: YoaK family protein [Peptococcaceae bacterium]